MLQERTARRYQRQVDGMVAAASGGSVDFLYKGAHTPLNGAGHSGAMCELCCPPPLASCRVLASVVIIGESGVGKVHAPMLPCAWLWHGFEY